MRPYFAPILALGLLTLGGCATLDQNECLNANWRAIGMEDGARGRELSYLGRHREACAEYGVSPDVDRYRQGRDEGLETYCTERRGYDMGKRNATYDGVCPAGLERDFLRGYRLGQDIYNTRERVKTLNTERKTRRDELAATRGAVTDLEARLVNRDAPRHQRAEWLTQLREQERLAATQERELADLEDELAATNARLHDLERIRVR